MAGEQYIVKYACSLLLLRELLISWDSNSTSIKKIIEIFIDLKRRGKILCKIWKLWLSIYSIKLYLFSPFCLFIGSLKLITIQIYLCWFVCFSPKMLFYFCQYILNQIYFNIFHTYIHLLLAQKQHFLIIASLCSWYLEAQVFWTPPWSGCRAGAGRTAACPSLNGPVSCS